MLLSKHRDNNYQPAYTVPGQMPEPDPAFIVDHAAITETANFVEEVIEKPKPDAEDKRKAGRPSSNKKD